MKLRKIDHIGIVVSDIAAAKAFFIELGLSLQFEGELGGELVDNIIGLQGVTDAFAFMQTPDGEATIELIQFYTPPSEKEPQTPQANMLGLRHLAFVVDDIEAIVEKMKKHGAELVGKLQQYEDSYKLCYLRGPEGILIELAEPLK